MEERNVAARRRVSLLYENKAISRGEDDPRAVDRPCDEIGCCRPQGRSTRFSTRVLKGGGWGRETGAGSDRSSGQIAIAKRGRESLGTDGTVRRDAARFYKSLLVHNKWEARRPREVESRGPEEMIRTLM